MRNATLNQAAWAAYLRVKAPFLTGARCTLEVLDPGRRQVTETYDALLRELIYDDDAQTLTLRAHDRDYVIDKPAEIRVLEDETLRPIALEVMDGQGIRHVLRIRPPRALC